MLSPIISLIGVATFTLSVQASLTSPSLECTKALASVLTDAGASACLNTKDLTAIAVNAGDNSKAETGLLPAINTWLTGACSQPACSNATLAAVTKLVSEGCWSDWGETCAPSRDVVDEFTKEVQQFYPTIRKVLCLKQDSEFCAVKVLKDFTSKQGFPIPLDGTNIAVLESALENPSKDIACSDCVKAAYTVITTDFPDAVAQAKPKAEGICGATFVDGKSPSGISQTTNTSVQSESDPSKSTDSKGSGSSSGTSGAGSSSSDKGSSGKGSTTTGSSATETTGDAAAASTSSAGVADAAMLSKGTIGLGIVAFVVALV